MTRKHYEAIARALRDAAYTDDPSVGFKGGYMLTDEEHNGFTVAVNTIADTFERLSPTFNKAKFLAACER